MAQPSARPKPNNLGLRVVSALILLGIALTALWFGTWWFALLLAVISGAMCWEWAGICCPDRKDVAAVMLAVAAAAQLLFVPYGIAAVLWTVGVGTAALGALAMLRRLPNAAVLVVGLPYVALGMASIGWLRSEPDGLATALWAAMSVAATDVGAYFTGRALKGPKLVPRISPNKTWSGLLGGMACAAVMGAGIAAAAGGPPLPAALVSIAIAVISQGGDLIESKLKRAFNVKDASGLIPGHGGFLDRFDGYLTALPAAALISAIAGGSPISWQ
jgi:phosphatidate cytidylyltransferase